MSRITLPPISDLQTAIKNYTSPTYIYDKRVLLKKVDRLKKAFSNRARIHYAVKANANPEILMLLAEQGLHADVVSGGEISRCMSSGFQSRDILFAGVGKSENEIRLALQNDIFMFNVESLQETERIEKVARDLNKTARLSIRINPDVSAKTHPYIATGFRKNKFGVGKKDIQKIANIIKTSRHLTLKGIGFHIGSQIFQAQSYLDAIKKTIPIYEGLRKQFDLEYFDIGGGFGVDYRSKKDFPLERFAKNAMDLLKPLKCQIITEPGRYLIAESGFLLTRVEYVKDNGYKTFVVVDTGMHHLIRPSLYSAYHHVVPLKKRKGPLKSVDVVGPICESSDFIALNRKLSPVEPGDFLLVTHAGAYGFVMSSQYNLRDAPQEILIP